MLMRGIQPPPLGSVKDRVMTHMYAMERQVEFDGFMALGSILTILTGADKAKAEVVFKILGEHRDKFSFRHWSVDKKKEAIEKTTSDLEILERLNRMGKR